LIAGVICSWAVSFKFRLGYDDSLDVVGVHLFGGMIGALSTGLFADSAINPAGADGLLFGGGAGLLGRQLIAVSATLVFSLVVSLVILKVVEATVGLRVSEEEELNGLDLSQHAEVGYALSESGGGSITVAEPVGVPLITTAAPVPQGSEA